MTFHLSPRTEHKNQCPNQKNHDQDYLENLNLNQRMFNLILLSVLWLYFLSSLVYSLQPLLRHAVFLRNPAITTYSGREHAIHSYSSENVEAFLYIPTASTGSSFG